MSYSNFQRSPDESSHQATLPPRQGFCLSALGLSSTQVWVETVSFEVVQGPALHSGWVLAL